MLIHILLKFLFEVIVITAMISKTLKTIMKCFKTKCPCCKEHIEDTRKPEEVPITPPPSYEMVEAQQNCQESQCWCEILSVVLKKWHWHTLSTFYKNVTLFLYCSINPLGGISLEDLKLISSHSQRLFNGQDRNLKLLLLYIIEIYVI